MISITSITRVEGHPSGKEIMAIGYISDIGMNDIFVQIEDSKATLHNGFVVSVDSNTILCRELPYTLGVLNISLLQGDSVSSVVPYTVTSVDNVGVAIPYTVRISHSKNRAPIALSREIKGGHHVFDNMYDFLYMPKELMEPTMTISVKGKDNVVRVYSLNWVDLETLPWPLLDADVGVSGSFRNYWRLQSESKVEYEFITDVEYAPDFNGNIPPFYENPQEGAFDRYSFPADVVWDEEREFTNTMWTNVKTSDHRWRRVKDTETGIWSRPFLISGSADIFQENRFIRLFERPQQAGSTIAVYTYFKGEQNRFGNFEMHSVIHQFYDRQPARREWADVGNAEQVAYEAVYGTVVDTNDPALLQRINQLWMVLISKDIHGNLKSAFSEVTLIEEGNGDLVRYSVDGKGDINAVRVDIQVNAVTDPNSIDFMYEGIGWTDTYNFGTHNFMAYRKTAEEVWEVRKTTAELGQFTKNYYKPFPINYYDRIVNPTTKSNYIPTGITAKNNAEDDITTLNWTDAPPALKDVPVGYELYMATSLFSVDSTKQFGDWVIQLASGRTPILDFITVDHTSFRTIISDSTDEQQAVTTRAYDYVNLKANIQQGGLSLYSLPFEDIRIVWERVYNAGAPDSTVIFNNFGKRFNPATGVYDEHPEDMVSGLDGFVLTGTTLQIEHTQVQSDAVFRLTQYRDVSGMLDFLGTGLEWIPYISEQQIADLVDRTVYSVVTSADAHQFVIKSDASFAALSPDSFIANTSIQIRAMVSNFPASDGSWYKWNHSYDFNTLKLSSSTEQWQAIERDKVTYWLPIADTNLTHNVLWNADGFNLEDTTFNVYKFQATVGTLELYDYTTITRVMEGYSAKDIKLSPDVFAIPLTADGLELDGSATKIFKVSSQNISAPSYTWSILDKSGNIIATKVGGTTFELSGDPTSTTANYKPLDIATLKTLVPITVRVEEMSDLADNLLEESLVTVLTGGSAAIKGDVGEGGFSVVYDHNDIIPSDSAGVPNQPVSEQTTVYIYQGTDARVAGTGPGEFIVALEQLPVGVLASVAGLTINVTDVPDEDTVTEIKFKILENNLNPLQQSGVDIIYSYKLYKSRAGSNAYSMLLTNEAQVVNVDPDNKVIGATIDGITNVIAHTKLRLFDGIGEMSVKGTDFSVKIDGLSTVSFGTLNAIYAEFKINDVSKDTTNSVYVRLNKKTNDLYVISDMASAATLPSSTTITITDLRTGQGLVKNLIISRLNAPERNKYIVIKPRKGTVFTSADSLTKELIFDVQFLIGTVPGASWGTVLVRIDGVTVTGRYATKTIPSEGGTLTILRANVGINSIVSVECVGIVEYLQIINTAAAEGTAWLYARTSTLNLSTGTPPANNPYAGLGSPSGDITAEEVQLGASTYSKVSNLTTWYKDPANAIYGVMRTTTGAYWSAPFRLVGEKGSTGKSLYDVTIYKQTTTTPALPTTDTLPPVGWSLEPPTSGTIWTCIRTFEYVGDTLGKLGANNEYILFPGAAWRSLQRITGAQGNTLINIYAKTGTDSVPAVATFIKESTIDSPWKLSMESLNPADSEFVWISSGIKDDLGNILTGWSAPKKYRFPIPKDGANGVSSGLFTWSGSVAMPLNVDISKAFSLNIGLIKTLGIHGLVVTVEHTGLSTGAYFGFNSTYIDSFAGDSTTKQWRTFFIPIAIVLDSSVGSNYLRFWSPSTDAGTISRISVTAVMQAMKGDQGDPGEDGAPGDTGGIGPIPAHEWSSTNLRFQKPDGAMGTYSNLIGPKGDKGDQGEQGLDAFGLDIINASATLFTGASNSSTQSASTRVANSSGFKRTLLVFAHSSMTLDVDSDFTGYLQLDIKLYNDAVYPTVLVHNQVWKSRFRKRLYKDYLSNSFTISGNMTYTYNPGDNFSIMATISVHDLSGAIKTANYLQRPMVNATLL